MTRLTITDARRVFCVAGLRQMMTQNGLDFKDFVQNGIEESVVRNATGMQAEIDRIVKAKQEYEGGR